MRKESNSLGRYLVVMPRTAHIQHTFSTIKQAEDWMFQADVTGFITLIVGEVSHKTERLTEVESKTFKEEV